MNEIDPTSMLYFRAKQRMLRSKAGFLGKSNTEQTLANLVERLHSRELRSLNDRIDELIMQREDIQNQMQ